MATFKVTDPNTGRTLRLTSQDDTPPTEQELEEVFSGIGEIRQAPGFLARTKAQVKRKGALGAKALLGDVPFVRKGLPGRIKEVEPLSIAEKSVFGLTRLGRDVFLLKGIGKIGVARTALRGAGIGIATAGTEDPEEIIQSAVKSGIALPVIKKGAELATSVITKVAQKGLKTTQQLWQDLIRAGFTVEKTTVQRVQQKGISNVFSKQINPELGVPNRADNALLKVGERIFSSAQKLRRGAGSIVGRWRQRLFDKPQIRVSVKNAKDAFQSELKQPTLNLIDEVGNPRIPLEIGKDTVANRLLEINEFLKTGDKFRPDIVYKVIDRLDDLFKKTRGTNEGRIVNALRKQLKQQIFKSAPTNLRKGLQSAEAKFAEVADTTDDVFNLLPLRKEGVALKERIGATERNLFKGLKQTTPIEERNVYAKLEKLLPSGEKFMELYKDVFAAQDLQREGIGFLLRRLLLAPRVAARGLQISQPPLRALGKGLRAIGEVTKRAAPPTLLRRTINDTP